VQTLLEKGARVNERSVEGMTALWIAAQEGYADIVAQLIEKDADVNSQRATDGITALWMTSQNGHAGVAKLLLENGADLDIRSANGSTALMLASQNAHTEIVKLLCEWGSDVNIKTSINHIDYSPLSIATMMERKDIEGILESVGARE
jgi:ankyrin repeat protein